MLYLLLLVHYLQSCRDLLSGGIDKAISGKGGGTSKAISEIFAHFFKLKGVR